MSSKSARRQKKEQITDLDEESLAERRRRRRQQLAHASRTTEQPVEVSATYKAHEEIVHTRMYQELAQPRRRGERLCRRLSRRKVIIILVM